MSGFIFIGQIGLLVVFICFSAFFSASETAFISLGQHHFNKLKENSKNKKTLNFWFRFPNRVLTTTLVGNTIAENLAAITAASIAYKSTGRISFALMVGIVMFLLLLFGEIIPKTLAKKYAQKIVMFVARPLKYICLVFEPVNRLFLGIAEVLLSVFNIEMGSIIPVLTEEDLKSMISAGEKEGLIELREKEMIHSIFKLGDKMVREIMIPRVNISAIEIETPIEEVIDMIVKTGFSRYPVYKRHFDKIVGLIYIKDIIAKHDATRNLTAGDIMRQAYFVPDTKKVDELLKELQRDKLQMAIIVDEYGGTAGIVTMEDLIEEIVGEISDEYKIESGYYHRLDDGSFIVKGDTEYEKVNETLDLKLPKGDFETIAGFVLAYMGKVPRNGEKFIYSKNIFIIHEADRKTISWIRIKSLTEETKDEDL
ncbi:MAG: hemolysin family protein [Candidatus Omnitrophica bacterium]|nr:hemolysin family protein [Candidatus Omnitrophota bacterium]